MNRTTIVKKWNICGSLQGMQDLQNNIDTSCNQRAIYYHEGVQILVSALQWVKYVSFMQISVSH